MNFSSSSLLALIAGLGSFFLLPPRIDAQIPPPMTPRVAIASFVESVVVELDVCARS